MKSIKLLAAVAVICSVAACTSNKGTGKANGADSTGVATSENPKDLLPKKAEIDSVSYLLGINWGAMVKSYNMGELNFKEVEKGLNDFIKSTGNQQDSNFVKQFKINPEEMNRIIPAFIEKRSAYTAAVNKKAENDFLEGNKKKAGVQTTESGLQYIITEAGNEVKPGPQDTVFVHYKLSKRTGEVIEEVKSTDPSVMLMNNRVVRGWAEGISLLGEGGKGTFFVPSALGYGERGNQGIEPNTTLVFDIQLDSVKVFVPKEN